MFYYSFIPGIEPTSIAPDLSSKGSKNVNQRIENLEWCGDPPEDIFGIQILSAFVEIAVVEDRTREEGDEIQSPSQKVQVEFNVKAKANPNIFVPNSKYSFDLWEEVTGTHDKIRKGDLCTYFSENGVSCREEGETLLEGSLVGSVPGYPSRYEAMFTAYGFQSFKSDS